MIHSSFVEIIIDEEIKFTKVRDYVLNIDNIEFRIALNNDNNLSMDNIRDFFLSSGSEDDYFLEVFNFSYEKGEIDNLWFFEDERHLNSNKIKKEELLDGTYNLKDFSIESDFDGKSILNFVFSSQ